MAIKFPEIRKPDEIDRLGLTALKKYVKTVSANLTALIRFEVIICPVCGKGLKVKEKSGKKNFYGSKLFSGNGNYFPICKDCLQIIASDINIETGKTNETPETVMRICHMLNKPFIAELYNEMWETELERVDGDKHRASSFNSYMNAITSFSKYDELTWADSEFGEAKNRELLNAKVGVVNEEIAEAGREYFGNIYSAEQLEFLENERRDWCAKYEIITKAQMELVLQLCSVKLQINEANQAGQNTVNLVKTYQDLMATLNVQPRQNSANSFADGKSFGEMIRMFEEHDPIELEDDPAFTDFDGIRKAINIWYKNASAEGLGINVDIDEDYQKEIKKYTVEKPQYEDDDTTGVLEKVMGISDV